MQKRFFSAILFTLLVSIPAFGQLFTYDWSMVGSAGVVDPSSAAHAFAGPALKFGTSSTGTIVARYPVTNTYGNGVDTTPAWQYLTLSYANDSALSSASARLMRVDKCSGDEEQMCSTSGGNTSGASACTRCLFNPGELDFVNNSYYVEVTITRTATSQNPKVHTVATGF